MKENLRVVWEMLVFGVKRGVIIFFGKNLYKVKVGIIFKLEMKEVF